MTEEAKLYTVWVILSLPGRDVEICEGKTVRLTPQERDAMGKEMSEATSGSITLANGAELVLPAGVFSHVFFSLSLSPFNNL